MVGKKGKFLLGMVLLLLLSACQTGEQEKKNEQTIQILTIGTADSGGTMYPVGRALAQLVNEHLPEVKMNIGASNGSVSNVDALRNGQIDLGLVSADVAYCAYLGKEEFVENPMQDLRTIGAVYFSCSNWLVADTLEIEYVHDLLGRRVAVGPETSSTELCARIALEKVGIHAENTDFENYGIGSGCDALLAGEIDAVHGLAGIPVRGMSKLSQELPCHLLGFTEEELEQILAENDQYQRTVIPAGTYVGQTEAVETFGVKCLLCVRADLDEELVYTFARLLRESVEDLDELHFSLDIMKDVAFVTQDLSIPLHSGAMRYYEEMGLLSSVA